MICKRSAVRRHLRAHLCRCRGDKARYRQLLARSRAAARKGVA